MKDKLQRSNLTLVIHVQDFGFKAQAIAWYHVASGDASFMVLILISL